MAGKQSWLKTSSIIRFAGIIEEKVYRVTIRTIEELCERIVNVWDELDQLVSMQVLVNGERVLKFVLEPMGGTVRAHILAE